MLYDPTGGRGMERSEALKTHLTQLSIISAAIMAGVVIFTGVVWYLLRSGAMPPTDLDLPSWFGPLANGVAVVTLFKAQFLPRLFGTPAREAGEEAWISWHRKTVIVGFAMREAAALIAMVGAMLTGRLGGAFLLVGLALLSMAVAWPRASHLRG